MFTFFRCRSLWTLSLNISEVYLCLVLWYPNFIKIYVFVYFFQNAGFFQHFCRRFWAEVFSHNFWYNGESFWYQLYFDAFNHTQHTPFWSFIMWQPVATLSKVIIRPLYKNINGSYIMAWWLSILEVKTKSQIINDQKGVCCVWLKASMYFWVLLK